MAGKIPRTVYPATDSRTPAGLAPGKLAAIETCPVTTPELLSPRHGLPPLAAPRNITTTTVVPHCFLPIVLLPETPKGAYAPFFWTARFVRVEDT
jgi:hypothetical protein